MEINTKTKTQTGKEETKIPYSANLKNTGILFDISGSYIYFYLDFQNKNISLVYPDYYNANQIEIYGYPIEFTVKSDIGLVEDVVDIIGGLEFNISGEELNLTGSQIAELLIDSPDIEVAKRDVTYKLIRKISQTGFTHQNFLHIIENSETNLTVIDCYYWSDNIQQLCKNLKVIN